MVTERDIGGFVHKRKYGLTNENEVMKSDINVFSVEDE